MNSRLSQLLTLVLAGTCGVLVLIILLFELGVGRGYSWWPLDTDEPALAKQDELNRASFKLSPWEQYADVNARPLFNENRKPSPLGAESAPGRDDRPIPKLSVILSGVVITSKVHLALIKEVGKTQSTMVKEGNALPGDLSGWSLARVKPRGALFRNAAGQDVELELIASGSGQKPPQPANPVTPQQVAPAPAGQPPAPPSVPDGPKPELQAKTADQTTADLQQRIETRRQQIREQNERAKQQQQPPPVPVEQQNQPGQ